MKIPSAAVVFSQAEGETGTKKLIIAFRRFPNTPENPYFFVRFVYAIRMILRVKVTYISKAI